ncbi:hypothetical protein KAH94_05350 [bacterium]|nr:hypothetical protein [bacterium]
MTATAVLDENKLTIKNENNFVSTELFPQSISFSQAVDLIPKPLPQKITSKHYWYEVNKSIAMLHL